MNKIRALTFDTGKTSWIGIQALKKHLEKLVNGIVILKIGDF